MALQGEKGGGVEERGGVSGNEAQSLQEVAQSSGHLPWLLTQHQTTGLGDLYTQCVYIMVLLFGLQHSVL